MTPLEHALAYAALGWRTIPIPPGAKYPKGRDTWQIDATIDIATITAWWTATPDHGVSIVTGTQSQIFVVDVDPRHGGDETLADLQHEHGKLPDTVECLTGGGGQHLYFQMPDGVTITNDAGKRLGPGLDVRGEGGQVVAPPTVHPDTGARYEWEASSDPFDGVQVALPPAWLVDMLTVELAPPRPRRILDPSAVRLDMRPGDRFEAETEWADLLTGDGWTLHSARNGRGGNYELWTRPGKHIKDGASASLYYEGSDVLKVFSSSCSPLEEGRTYSRFGYEAQMRYGGDHSAFGRELGQRYRPTLATVTSKSSTQAATETAETLDLDTPVATNVATRPMIVHNGRQLDALVEQAIDALVDANEPPTLFVRAGQIARLRADEDHRPMIEGLRVEHSRLALADAATWWRANKDGELTATSPPGDVATSVLARGYWPLPALAGVVELPVLRPDGTFHVEHGYDAPTRLYHWHQGAPYPPIPANPTTAEISAAVALVDEALCDFPWDTTADRANAWGLILTPLIRPIVGQVPMALVDAPEPGTGKGLLVTVMATIALGRPAGLSTMPTTEEEMDKVITTMLMAGASTIIFDNVDGIIRSGKLAAALTADVWSGRILGKSEMVTVPQSATWVATGNNIDVGGDLARRCYRIRLDARQAQPWKRSSFKHPDLADWVTANRVELLHALCTIVAGWHAAGRPEGPTLAAMGGYTKWVRTIGGILEFAGVPGFLSNLDDFHADADQEARQWESFLTAWHDGYGEQPLTTSELVNKVRDIVVGGPLREVLPEDLAPHIDSPGFSKRMGKQLRQKSGRHYGMDGVHVTEMPQDRRKLHVWCVTTRSNRLFEDVETAGFENKPAVDESLTRGDATSAGFAGFVGPTSRAKNQDNSVNAAATGQKKPAKPANPRTHPDDVDWGQF